VDYNAGKEESCKEESDQEEGHQKEQVVCLRMSP
jgi:hypothetical protein